MALLGAVCHVMVACVGSQVVSAADPALMSPGGRCAQKVDARPLLATAQRAFDFVP